MKTSNSSRTRMWLAVCCLFSCAQSSGSIAIADQQKQVFQFPTKPIGQLSLVNSWLDYFCDRRRPLGPAAGTIKVGDGKELVFEPSGLYFEKPELIKQVSPGAIRHIRIRFNSMDETDTITRHKALKFLRTLKGLKTADFDKSDVRDADLEFLQGQTELIAVSANNSWVNGSFLRMLRTSKKIQYIRCSVVSLRSETLSMLAEFPKLETLVVFRSNLKPEGLKEICQCKQLKTLDISKNSLITDSEISDLKKQTQLKRLNLKDTNISANGLFSLARSLPGTVIIAPGLRSSYPISIQNKQKHIENIMFDTPGQGAKPLDKDFKMLFAPTMR